MAAQRPPAFRGRSSEREALDRLLETARGGRSALLVIRGEAGVGKTALLRYTAGQASDFRIAHITGVESEMELAYAALHQLCVPMIDGLDGLPAPQQVALNVALGIAVGDPPDRFLVALATLSLLAAIAEEQPLLCFVDDLQWLDQASAQVLGFVARRLLAEPVALVFAVREPSGELQLVDLPELRLEGLEEEDARALLAAVIPGPIDERVRDRIVAETHGNPLALLELPHGIGAPDLAGGFGVPGPAASVTSSIEDGFRRRVELLPTDARRLLQLAAADPVGEPLLVWRAAGRLGIDPQAAATAADAGLLEIGAQVRFRHPLVRSAAYRSASPTERLELHAALAEATDPHVDPDRRACHHAQAVLGPDEEVADELVRSAARAQARGGIAAAAAFLDRAAALTPGAARRAERLLVAARTMRDAGQLDVALERLAAVEAASIGAREAAEVEHLRGQIAFDQRRLGDATRLLLSAARRFEPVDAASARTTHLEALGAAMWAGDLEQPGGMLEAGRAARDAPPAADPPAAVDLLLDAFAIRLTDGYAAAAPALRQALDTAMRLNPTTRDIGLWLWLTGSRAGGAVALELWDVDSAHTLASRQVQVARDTGALVQLQFALNFVSRIHILRGDLAAAASAIDEQRRIAEATGRPSIGYTEMILAAWRGRERPASESIKREAERAAAGGIGRVVVFADYMRAVLYNGIGRYDAARDAAQRAFERAHLAYDSVVLAELAEAASRTGDSALSEVALERVSEYARVTPGDWVVGIEARVRALACKDDVERDYRDSIACLERARVRSELARSHLLFGEWLRREGRRVDAREQLRIAHEMLSAMGAEAFAERARHELVATGEKVRKRTDDTRDDLTPQEQHIARLAMAGRTNPEIGAELFLSPRTVEWHLKKVFTKLGISSRRALRDALPQTVPV
jgi:DNA-binding CsgD family transcriptional regulator